MNKNAIKKFAIAARTRLIATVSDKAGMLGITKDGISAPTSKGNGFEVYKTVAGTEVMLQGNQMEQRRRLVSQIEARGFDVIMEEVAYTWFNRICAIRFMEANDYLPSRVRVLSSVKDGKNEPDILTEAPDVDLDFMDKEREFIINAKAENKLDDLFSMLFIKQCNKLSEILPELFEATQDYTEMLLSLSYTNEDDVIRMLVDGVDEADFNVTTPDENGKPTGQVEIIGWLYQYYNTELKDDTFAQLKKNVKISKERIPAATQLFTPDWIVRYMVENSVGRIWIEHLRAIKPDTDEKDTAEHYGWKYYLPEAEQEPDVNVKLAEIRKSYADIKPEDILCIDPCMGSGHILVAMFDVLMDIYKSVGFGEREAAFEIVEHNIHGLDIDKRAYQLAYFAVMMKGRQYNRRFFRGKEEGLRPRPKVYAFVESNDINRAQLKFLGADLSDIEKNNALNQMNGLLDSFKDAREYGSILNVDNYDWDLLRRFIKTDSVEGQISLDAVGLEQVKEKLGALIEIGEILAKKYDVVVTNPPYMGSGGMSAKLSEYVRDSFAGSKADLFGVFIEKCSRFTKPNAYFSMITQHAWMFLSSFENLRKLVMNYQISGMIHLGARAFDEIGGEVVQSTTFTCRKLKISDKYKAVYIRTVDVIGELNKRDAALNSIAKHDENYIVSSTEKYRLIPGNPIAYWISDNFAEVFRNKQLTTMASVQEGLKTADNERFIRLWFEVNINKTNIFARNEEKKWIKHTKGGQFRRWYGNNDAVLNYENNGYELKNFKKASLTGVDNYFKPSITWTRISTGAASFRYTPVGSIPNMAGLALYCENELYFLALLNSRIIEECLVIMNPTLNYPPGTIGRLPVIYDDAIGSNVCELAKECVEISKEDWDSFETSWDFKHHPLLPPTGDLIADKKVKISERYKEWEAECNDRFNTLKRNEEELNHIFIEIYGLQDELTPEVEDKDVTVRKADMGRDVCSLISYVVGCMFGRYSHVIPGIVYAGGEWPPYEKSDGVREKYFPDADPNVESWMDAYGLFAPDVDNIIPITDEEYFGDDIVARFVDFIKIIYGEDTLEENLDFIAKALGNKGDTSRDVIRNYFLNDFFKDHCNTYSVTGSGKRPIYWLFDSGKENGFKCLIYLHRYDQDTVGRIRTDYLHKTQKAIEQAMASAQYTLENASSGTEKSKATKRISKYTKQLAEIQLYDEAIAHIANQRIALDLDDGVKVNYAKFQGVEVSREGMKTVKVDLLAKI